MAFVEEVFENKGGLYGAHTGHKYEKVCVEDIGGQLWSKPYHYVPGEVNLELEELDKEVSKENTQKPGGNPY